MLKTGEQKSKLLNDDQFINFQFTGKTIVQFCDFAPDSYRDCVKTNYILSNYFIIFTHDDQNNNL
jgi:hypothetical protein